MAYMKADGKGPYPNKVGEYCGNHNPNHEPARLVDQTLEQARQSAQRWLSNKRLGRPHSCKAGTSKEMAAKGWFGVYLAEDSTFSLLDGDYEVPTPAELMEPEASR